MQRGPSGFTSRRKADGKSLGMSTSHSGVWKNRKPFFRYRSLGLPGWLEDEGSMLILVKSRESLEAGCSSISRSGSLLYKPIRVSPSASSAKKLRPLPLARDAALLSFWF